MQLFSKEYGTEVFHYYSDADVYTLKKQMKEVFEYQRKFKSVFSRNLTGKFTTVNQFTVSPRLRIGYTRNVAPTSITGELIANGKRTEVVFMLSPVPFHIYFYASIFLGVFGLYRFYENRNHIVLIAALSLISIVPYLMLRVVKHEKRELKATFISTFNLIPKDLF